MSQEVVKYVSYSGIESEILRHTARGPFLTDEG